MSHGPSYRVEVPELAPDHPLCVLLQRIPLLDNNLAADLFAALAKLGQRGSYYD
jgi:hypothetical protein